MYAIRSYYAEYTEDVDFVIEAIGLQADTSAFGKVIVMAKVNPDFVKDIRKP